MNRYLMFISYIGTNYRGLQRVAPNIGKYDSIQAAIEFGLNHLNAKNAPINLCLSSRTDKGVHAISNTVQVNLEHPKHDRVFLPKEITRVVNKSLQRHDHQIAVKKTLLVSPEFHCRKNARWRRYIYRLAIAKPHTDLSQCSAPKLLTPVTPITEQYRTLFLSSDISLDLMSRACELFLGTHDFATFMGSRGIGMVETTVRHLDEVDIRPSITLNSSRFDPLYDNFDFYEINIRARSFLNRQVRRMVGTIVSVGHGQISLDQLKFMIDNPSKHSWLPFVSLAPSYGLYLAKIHYDPEDLIYKGPLEIDFNTGQIIKRLDPIAESDDKTNNIL